MLATPRNMEKVVEQSGVFAYSPATGEQYSANPGDYWDHPKDAALKDSEGERMVLATSALVITTL